MASALAHYMKGILPESFNRLKRAPSKDTFHLHYTVY